MNSMFKIVYTILLEALTPLDEFNSLKDIRRYIDDFTNGYFFYYYDARAALSELVNTIESNEIEGVLWCVGVVATYERDTFGRVHTDTTNVVALTNSILNMLADDVFCRLLETVPHEARDDKIKRKHCEDMRKHLRNKPSLILDVWGDYPAE